MQSFIIIGAGRFGDALARELYKEGHEVLVVDNDEDTIQRISDHVTHAVIGDAADPNVLASLGVRNFDCAVVSIASDLQNSILITLILKEMGVPYVIAKARNEVHTRVLNKIGADKVIFPEREMGERLAQLITKKNVLDYLELSDDYSIMEITAPKAWHGKTLIELNIRAQYGVTVIAVRDEKTEQLTVSLDAHFKIKRDDILIVLGANEDIEEIDKL
ncbi:MAG: TrkA family potassium uptake protein [Clostridia bacterium]